MVKFISIKDGPFGKNTLDFRPEIVYNKNEDDTDIIIPHFHRQMQGGNRKKDGGTDNFSCGKDTK
jgi:hypothetical protein